MDNPMRVLFQKLAERIFGLIAGSIGRTVSINSTLYAAEQQSELEDLARRYESEGKQTLADQVRLAARNIAEQDPAQEGAHVYQRLAANSDMNLQLPAPEKQPAQARRRRSRRANTTNEASTESREESHESS